MKRALKDEIYQSGNEIWVREKGTHTFEGDEEGRLGEDAPLWGVGLGIGRWMAEETGEVGAVLGMNRTSLEELSSIGGGGWRRQAREQKSKPERISRLSTLDWTHQHYLSFSNPIPPSFAHRSGPMPPSASPLPAILRLAGNIWLLLGHIHLSRQPIQRHLHNLPQSITAHKVPSYHLLSSHTLLTAFLSL